MPTGLFLVGYNVVDDGGRKLRVCAMDEFTRAIQSDGGDWAESEVAGDRAVVHVEASEKTLATLAGVFPALSRNDAEQFIAQGRQEPRWDGEKYVFDSRPRPSVPLEKLEEKPPDKPSSRIDRGR